MAVASSAMLDNKHHRQQKEQQQQVDSTPEQQEQQAVESLPPTVTPESPPLRAYDPDRVFTPAQLETLNILSAPIWIFDYVERRSKLLYPEFSPKISFTGCCLSAPLFKRRFASLSGRFSSLSLVISDLLACCINHQLFV